MSNDLKDLIYSEVYTGGSSSKAVLSTLQSLSSTSKPTEDSSDLSKRINRVSGEFGISKKRIEAVLKLKEHERGMKERGEVSILFPLGSPFLDLDIYLRAPRLVGDLSRRRSSMMKQNMT